jgi:hypothetical protein
MRFGAVALLPTLWTVLAAHAPRVEACTCVAERANMLWPVHGSQGVPIDTPIVISASTMNGLRIELRELDGEPVDFDIIRTVQVPPGCDDGVVFLKARRDLSQDRYYSLVPSFETGRAGAVLGGWFRTGSGRRDPQPPEVKLSLLAHEIRGSRFLNVFAEHRNGEPAFLVGQTAFGSAVRFVGRRPGEEPSGLDLGAQECANVELVDLTGRALHAERMCDVHACVENVNVPTHHCTGQLGMGAWAVLSDKRHACGTSRGCTVGRDGRSSATSAATALLLLVAFVLLRIRGRLP